jgi:hypothetical protein
MAGVGLVALVLLLTWVTSGPYVNLFAPFDDSASGVGSAPSGYQRYEGMPETARGVGGGGVWLIALGLLAGVVLLGLLTWGVRGRSVRFPRRRGRIRVPKPGPPVAGSVDQTDGVLHAAIGDLTTGDDPRDSIIAAWRDLEKASEAAGRSLAISRTPDDVTAMLAELSGDRDASAEFERIYVAARYGEAPVTEESRERAITLLTRLQGQVSAGAGGDPQ